jgi:hypothetical protein
MKKILVISRGAWNSNNSIGNTLNNFFSSTNNCEFHNVYLRAETPGNNCCKSIYQITEHGLLRSLKTLNQTGKVLNSTPSEKEAKKEEQFYRSYQNKNLYSLWFARDLLWTIGNWRKNLKHYIREIDPDVIFMPVFGCVYAHKVLSIIQKESHAKVVLFHADDHYSLKHKNTSPLFWLYRFWLRKWIRHSVKSSAINYCISDLQIIDYNKYFHTQCKLLQKFGDFSCPMPQSHIGNPINIVFTGNMECGRWKSLALIAESVNVINTKLGLRCTLDIYSATKLNRNQQLLFDGKMGVSIKGFVQSSNIPDIQNHADILVHVESFDLNDKLRVRQSFSTKIVDYLSKGKCILAVGPSDVASIQYFEKHDAGYVINDGKEINNKLLYLVTNENIMSEYAQKAWACGSKNNNNAKKDEFIQELLNL